MPVRNLLKDMLNHMNWADAKMWDTVLSNPAIHKHKKLWNVLYHLHSTQHAFYQLWLDLPLDLPQMSDFKNINDLAGWAAKYYELSSSFLSSLKEKELNRVIIIPWSNRPEKPAGKQPSDTTLAETVIQVAMHSSYHRGQVNSLLRTLNVDPPLVDFIIWLWLGKPLSKWPAV